MAKTRKPSKQRDMLDPHQPLLTKQENELIAQERDKNGKIARLRARLQQAIGHAKERLKDKN
jgi:hypothetical protein